MRIVTILQWLFVYLPVRFTVPFLSLLAWFLFYLWPWLLDIFFPADPQGDIRDTIRTTIINQFLPGKLIDELNLGPAVDAAGVLILLLAGVLVVYNIAALMYRINRRWPREKFLVATLLLNTFIYSYPWIFA